MRLALALALAALTACLPPAMARAQEQGARARFVEAEGVLAETMVTDRRILVRDLAVLRPGERETIGGLVAARIPAGQSAIELSAGRRAALLRRRVPGRDLRLLHEGPQRFAARAAGTGGEDRRAGRECFALRQNLPAGAYVTGEVLVPAACKKDTARPLPLRYDASAGATELARPLSAGTYLGRVAVRAGEIVESGRTLVLSVREGPVRIEREVHALQPSRTGRAIFVRTADGQILAAPLATTGTAESAR